MQVLEGSTKEKKQKRSKTFVPPNVVTRSAANAETEDDGETESPTQKAGEGGTNGNESSPMLIQTSRGSNSTEENVLVLSEREGIDSTSYNLFTGLVAKFSIEVLTLVLSLVSVAIVDKGALKEKRNARKPTMGHGVHEWSRRNGGAKMPIDFTPGMRRPTDPVQAAKLSSECGIQIRSKMPLATHWKQYGDKESRLKDTIPETIKSITVSPLTSYSFSIENVSLVDDFFYSSVSRC
jgi:hypothetical protein